jgi:hypothetical protein
MGLVHGGRQIYYSYTNRGNCEGVWRETVVMGWEHGGWQKYYSHTDRGTVKGFGETVVMGWVPGVAEILQLH